jgi:hypothetical protein
MIRADAPRRVDGYALHGPIASGGMATVHYGWREGARGFGRLVAIKALHPHLAREREIVATLIDEARLAARLRHPNIAPVLDVVDANGELLLVIEYVAGVPLSLLLQRALERHEAIDPRIAVAIGASVLRALHAAHEATSDDGKALGLVHRDVSPQNVIVGADGVARLVDFGIAKAAGRVQTTRDGQRKGKLAYMAPEQIDGGAIDRRCDLFAAAILVWEMLVGEPLFAAPDETAVLARRVARIATPSARRDGLPRAFDDVVMRGLEREARRRFPTALMMAEALEGCASQASATEIGEWVRQLAGDVLDLREAEAARVEAAHATKAIAEEPARARRSHGHGLIVGGAVILAAAALLAALRTRGARGGGDRRDDTLQPSAHAETFAVESSSAVVTPLSPPSSPPPPPLATTSASRARAQARTQERAPDAAASRINASCTPPFRVDANGVKRYKLECR